MPTAIRAIIILCILVEAVLSLAALAGWPIVRPAAFALGAFYPDLLAGRSGIYPGQAAVMFVTYGFLHAGLLHLAMNMAALAQLGMALRHVLTGARMLLVYAVAQVAAGATQAVMAPAGPSMVGASGAVFGLAGAYLSMSFVAARRRRLPMGPLIRAAALIAGLNVALPLLIPQIAWQAHLGGVVAGLAMGAWYARGLR